MNKRHYEHTLPNIRGSLSNTYTEKNIAGSVKPSKPSARKYVFICLAKRVWSDG